MLFTLQLNLFKMATQKDLKLVFKTNNRLMQIKSIAECSKGHSAILKTFIQLPFDIKIFVLSIFEWPFYTGFTGYELLISSQSCDFISLLI